jgi:hypothetical protein
MVLIRQPYAIPMLESQYLLGYCAYINRALAGGHSDGLLAFVFVSAKINSSIIINVFNVMGSKIDRDLFLPC